MRIVFLLESAGLWGGVKTVIDDAHELQRRGHRPMLVCKTPPPEWCRLEVPFRQVDGFDHATIPAADVVVGTYWTTVPFAVACGRGVPIHFCQGYEGDNAENAAFRERIDQVYALPVPKVTISGHLERTLRTRFGGWVRRVVYAIDHATMRPPEGPRTRRGPLRVGLVGPWDIGWKDIPTGMRAAAIANRAGLPLIVVRVSNTRRHPDEAGAPVPIEWHERLEPTAMGDFYRSLDVFLGTSLGPQEGFFMPAVEAMACGVPAILTDIPCFRDYGSGEYACFVPPAQPVAMAKAVARLACDPAYAGALRRAGLEVAARYRRDRHVDELERAFHDVIRAARAVPGPAPAAP